MSASFYQTFADVITEDKRQTREWVEDLRQRGVRAAHPDDGWVNRDTNEVIMTYPYFCGNLKVNDIIVLGDYREYRVVRIIAIREAYIGSYKYYKFIEE